MEKSNGTAATTRTSIKPDQDWDARALHRQADRCRRLAGSISDQATIDMLNRMAGDYECMADSMMRKH